MAEAKLETYHYRSTERDALPFCQISEKEKNQNMKPSSSKVVYVCSVCTFETYNCFYCNLHQYL